MSANDRMAIAAHLHVLLRRKTGRVTDTEWMAENLEYATAIVRFARAKAAEDGHADLAEWAERLEHAMNAPPARKPLLQTAAQLLRERSAPAPAAAPALDPSLDAPVFAAQRPPKPADPDTPRYVGGIR